MADRASASGGSGSTKQVTYKISADTRDFEKKVSQMKKTLKSFQSTASKFTKSASKLAKGMTGFGLASANTSKAVKRVSSAVGKFSSIFGRIFKMMRLMLLRKAIRAVIENIGDGFKGLAMYSKDFDNSMSAITNSSRQLGYSFSAMVAPLINAFAPALTYIIQLCNKAVVAVTQLFNALSGKSTFITAKEQIGSWAESLDEANGKAKKLKNTILGFDEINKLNDDSDSGSGSGIDPDSMFETKNIDDRFKNLAEKIKDIFNKIIDPIKKAWAKVGDYVVSSWKKAFNSIKELGKSIFSDLLEVWQQENTVKIFENILHIIGDIGQAVSNLADNFRKAWEKNETGKKILENIRDIVLIISEHADNMADSFVKWTEDLDFEPLLNAFERFTDSLKPVADFVGGVLEDLWNNAILPFSKHLVEETVPNLIKVFTDFNNNVEWENLRSKLNELWEALEPFAENVADGLVIFIKDVSKAVGNFLNSDNFNSFIDAIIRWMDSVDANEVARTLEVVAGAFLAYKTVPAVIIALTNPITAFVAVITTLYMAIRQLLKDIKAYKEYLGKDSLWDAILNGDKDKKQEYALTKGHDPYAGGLGEKYSQYREQLKTLKQDLQDGKVSTEEYYQALQNFPSSTLSVVDIFKKKVGEYSSSLTKDTSDISKSYTSNVATVKTQNVELEKSYASTSKSIVGEMGTITKGMKDTQKSLETDTSKIKNSFSKENWTFSGVAEGLKQSFSDAVSGIKSIWNQFANRLNGRSFEIGNKTINFRLPTFATGGFPEDGLFMANHNEMVGRFSNGKTAVANNEQITTGIANAVYQAMMMANGGNNNSGYINNTIMIDSEVIARAVTKGQNSISRRYSPSMA